MSIQKIDQGKTIKMVCTVCKKDIEFPRFAPIMMIREQAFRRDHFQCVDKPVQEIKHETY